MVQSLGYDYWDWGIAAEWAAAFFTFLAFAGTIGIFLAQQYYSSRHAADSFHTSLWANFAVGIGAGTASSSDLVVHAANTGGTAISLPCVFVPVGGGSKAYIPIQLFDATARGIPGGYELQKSMQVADPNAIRRDVIVRFTDARNRSWIRYIDSGRYVVGLARWRMERSLRGNVEAPTSPIVDIIPLRGAMSSVPPGV